MCGLTLRLSLERCGTCVFQLTSDDLTFPKVSCNFSRSKQKVRNTFGLGLVKEGDRHAMKTTCLSFALVALGTWAAWAGSICPAGTGALHIPYSPDAAATGCNVVITIHADRSATVTVMDPTPYEFSEDVLVGVVNNSSSNLPGITLSGTGIFDLDSDGICTFTFVGSGYCTPSQVAGTDPQDYYGPNTTFAITSVNNGTVNFTTPIAAGGSAYFSLDGLPSASLVADPATPGTPAAAGVPVLSVGAMLVLAGMLVGSGLWAIRAGWLRQE
jgi:hypothetical protein